MAENKQDGIAIFDTLFTNNHICMMKLLLPLLSPSMQKSIALYIKYRELQYTLLYFSKHPLGLVGVNATGPPTDTGAVLDSILPYCNDKERQSITQIRNLMQTMQSMKDMMEMMETMKELFPEGFSGGSGDGNSMDFSQMSEMFSAFGGGASPDMFKAFSQGGISPEILAAFSGGTSPDIFSAFTGGGNSAQPPPARE